MHTHGRQWIVERVTGVVARTVFASQALLSQTMQPDDANPHGTVHGGTIMKLVDSSGGVCAIRHCRTRVVTARMEAMDFVAPVHVGDVVTLKASVNQAFQTSMEVGVRVEAENLLTGQLTHVASAYLIYVSVDEFGRPQPIPQLVAETDEQRLRMSQAEERRRRRLEHSGSPGQR
jgi:acyl-CoA hydrolase